MPLFELIILALIQGLTEFLPISSSAHLILPSQILGWDDQGLAFDLAVHLGTLMAVIVYLRRDVWKMMVSCLVALRSRQLDDESRLALFVVAGTLPAVFIGFFIKDFVETELRSVLVIALASIFFGLLLAFVDRREHLSNVKRKFLSEMTLNRTLVIGFAQALAFIPGTSRSGITITAALALGFSRTEALRFSFLLSIPLIVAGALLSGKDLVDAKVSMDVWNDILLAMAISGLSAFACIHLFMKWVERVGMMPFVIYRVILGLVLLFIYFQV